MKQSGDGRAALYFEDVVVGREYVSGRRRVTELDLSAFADISGDRHPIHTDPEYARTTPFGQCILHGPFGVAVALGLFTQFAEFTDAAIAITDIKEWRFLAPVLVGDELTLRMNIENKRLVSAGGRGVIQRRMQLINQCGIVVQEGLMGLMMLCRRQPAAASEPGRETPV